MWAIASDMGNENLGLLAFNYAGPDRTLTPENQMVIDTIAHLGAMALDRIRFHQ